MSTDTPTTAKHSRRAKPKQRFVVTKTIGDKTYDCRLASRAELGVGSELAFKRGLLVACKDREIPEDFPGDKSARRFIGKTVRTIKRLRESALQVDKMPRLQELLTPGTFDTRVFVQ